MNKFYKQPSKVLIYFLLFLFLVPFSASAIELGGLEGRPAKPDPAVPNSDVWFIYNLNPGESHEDALVVQNNTDADEKIVIYPADSTPSSDGSFALKQKAETMSGVGLWIKFYPGAPPELSASLKASLYDIDTNLDSLKERCQIVQLPYGASEASFVEYLNNSLQQLLSEEEVAYLSKLDVWCQGKPEAEFDLEPQASLVVPFVISIPQGLEAGEQTGGIVVEQVKTADALAGNQNQLPKIAFRVYETVPGEIIQDVSVTGWQVRYDKQKEIYIASLHLQNNGNVSQALDIDFVVNDLLFDKNNLVLSRPVQVLRDSELIADFEWPTYAKASAGRPEKNVQNKPSVKFGRFALQADIKVDTAEGEKTISTPAITLWLIPWLEIFIGLVLLLFILSIYFYWWYLRHKLASHQGWQPYKVKKTDTLSGLASRGGVTWRKIVLVNKLSKPYLLTPGQVLLLPVLPPKQDLPVVSASAASQIMPSLTAKAKSYVKPITSLTAGIGSKNKIAKPVIDSATQMPAMTSLEPTAQSSHLRFWIIGVVVFMLIVVSWLVFKPQTNEETSLDSTRPLKPTSGQVYDLKTGEFKDLYPAAKPALVPDSEPGPENEKKAREKTEPKIIITPAEITLQVLNGSGVKGAASQLAQKLKKLNYNIGFIGNANRFNYQNMTVIYKPQQDYKFALIKKHLSDLGYLVIDGEDTGKSDTVIIVIGK